jgi:hypothetical protein
MMMMVKNQKPPRMMFPVTHLVHMMMMVVRMTMMTTVTERGVRRTVRVIQMHQEMHLHFIMTWR